MLERLSGWLRLLWDSSRILQEHTQSIESSKQREVKFVEVAQFLLAQVQHLERELDAEREARKTEMEHERELRKKDLENLELRLKLEISEKLRQLPLKTDG